MLAAYSRTARLGCGVLVLAALSSCAIDRGVDLPELSDWEVRRELLGALADWGFSGRIGVSAGEEGFNGRLRWRQISEAFTATVSGPFGAGAVRLEGTPERIVVSERDERVEFTDPEHDLRVRYGWTIPVTSLRYWALGIPSPGAPAATEFGDNGQLARLTQGGWSVSIPQYREDGGQLMPRRIVATNGDAKVRLVIDDWTFYELPVGK